jgi:DOMON domain
VYDVMVMQNTYLAIGYGTSMTNTDMAFWGANGAQSVMNELYGTGHTKPSVDATNAYNTTLEVLPNGATHFVSTRTLDPGTPNTFVIPLDTPINMICAFLNTTSNLQYHTSPNHFQWTMQLNSNGT